jgi:hypothetical protein
LAWPPLKRRFVNLDRFAEYSDDHRRRRFPGATALATVQFPSDLLTIGNNAFEWCSSLTTVDLPANLTEISARAFADNESLTSVTLRALTPPIRFASSFASTPSGLRYMCRIACLTIYRNHENWSAYADVILSL